MKNLLAKHSEKIIYLSIIFLILTVITILVLGQQPKTISNYFFGFLPHLTALPLIIYFLKIKE